MKWRKALCGGETKLSKDLMLLHVALHPMQFRAALFLILERQRLQWLPINSISPLNISCFLLFLYFSGGKVCSTFEAIAWFRLLTFNVFHFCVYNVCCKFAAVAQCPDHFNFTSWHFMFSSSTFSNVCNNLIFVDPFHPTYSTQSTHRVNDKQSTCPLI